MLRNIMLNSGLEIEDVAREFRTEVSVVVHWFMGDPRTILEADLIRGIREMVRPLEMHIAHNLKISNRDPELKLDRPSWAVLYRGTCINKDLEEEYEPQPSSRDDEFYERCRFTFDVAKEVAKRYKES